LHARQQLSLLCLKFFSLFFWFRGFWVKCAKCGNPASKYNKTGVPVCSRHARARISSPNCPNCGLGMAIREGKFGKFWGCPAFPMCDGLQKI